MQWGASMPNKKHVAILKKGVRAWNAWRDESDGRADLRGAKLYRADLGSANLSGADLNKANLSGANLRRANLTGANLSGGAANNRIG
jgi:uncharacterized protein YjbI with pentapeptide repeats